MVDDNQGIDSKVNYKKAFDSLYDSIIKSTVDEDKNTKRFSDEIAEKNTLIDYCNDINSIKTHNMYFDEILAEYSMNIKNSNLLKVNLKMDFYWFCKDFMLGILFIQFIAIFVMCGLCSSGIIIPESTLNTLLISVTGTLLTSFIVLPIIIAKYLFNPNEERYTGEVIKNIQKHDSMIRKFLHKHNSR